MIAITFIINLAHSSMIETFIQIENYIYPFEECKGQTVKVEDVQAFTSQK